MKRQATCSGIFALALYLSDHSDPAMGLLDNRDHAEIVKWLESTTINRKCPACGPCMSAKNPLNSEAVGRMRLNYEKFTVLDSARLYNFVQQ